jgi:molybdopterin-guanine dinucleotide biosynthesis protein A
MAAHPAYSALILAGGTARRFGAADKGLQLLDGRPLVEHTLGALEKQQPAPAEILISANRNLEQYTQYGRPVYPDRRPGFQGPLAGIAEGLAHAIHDWLLVVPCDVAVLPPDFAARLFAESEDVDAVCACDTNQMHPSLLLVRTRMAPSLDEFLHGESRRMRDWLARLKLREAFFTTPFANLNTPQDLAAHQVGNPR